MPVTTAAKVEALSVDFRSAARLADMLGVSRSQVTRWLRGSGIDPENAEKVDLYLDDVLVAKRGGRFSGYREEQGAAVMKKAEFGVTAVLHRGRATATVWTCDLSFDYVKINAEYRT